MATVVPPFAVVRVADFALPMWAHGADRLTDRPDGSARSRWIRPNRASEDVKTLLRAPTLWESLKGALPLLPTVFVIVALVLGQLVGGGAFAPQRTSVREPD